jgi:uncharacterized protein (DUF849 family)
MAAKRKVIITCAVTGAIHTPTVSPHLPITPDEITREALAAAEAGASILHLHARNPETGQPDQTPAAFGRFLPRIKQGTNAVINITAGGNSYMKVEERVLPTAIPAMPISGRSWVLAATRSPLPQSARPWAPTSGSGSRIPSGPGRASSRPPTATGCA